MGLKEPGLRGSLRNVSVGIGAIPDNVVDNFEDGNADPAGVYESEDTIADFYSGDTSGYARTTTEVIEGGNALEYTGDVNGGFIASEPNNGLNRYPAKGEIISGLLRDTSTDHVPQFIIGAEVSEGDVSGYGIQIRPDESRLRIARYVDSSEDAVLAETTSASLNFDEWYDCEVEWHDGSGSESDNEIVFTVYEIDEDTLERENEVASISANDSTFEDNSGVGFRAIRETSETLFDFVRVTGEV